MPCQTRNINPPSWGPTGHPRFQRACCRLGVGAFFPNPTRKDTYGSVGAHVWILFLCRSRTRLGKIRVLSFPS